jgi:predicted amidophosphoribosyltransferase
MITCVYCGREWQERDGVCSHCGAPNKIAKMQKFEPFFYDGYIVYCLRDYARCLHSWIFYKGITFMGRVDIDDGYLQTLSPAMDIMPLLMERLRLR